MALALHPKPPSLREWGFLFCLPLLSAFFFILSQARGGNFLLFLWCPTPILVLLYNFGNRQFVRGLIVFFLILLLYLGGSHEPVLISPESFLLLFPFFVSHVLVGKLDQRSNTGFALLVTSFLPFLVLLFLYSLYFLILNPGKNLERSSERVKIHQEILYKTIENYEIHLKSQTKKEEFEEGVRPNIEKFKKQIPGFVEQLNQFIPGTQFFFLCFFLAFWSYFTLPIFSVPLIGSQPVTGRFADFKIYWGFIWPFILSLVGSVYQAPVFPLEFKLISLNVMAILSLLFFTQGFAIWEWWLKLIKWPLILRLTLHWFVAALFFLSGNAGFFLTFFVVLGILEIWLPLRPQRVESTLDSAHQIANRDPNQTDSIQKKDQPPEKEEPPN